MLAVSKQMVHMAFKSFEHVQNVRFSDMKIEYFQGCPHNYLVLFKYFGKKYGVRGSRFRRFFGRSKIVLKSIAIDQESLISNFGVIETPKTLKKTRTNNNNKID